jgi:hypothetical protein
VSVLDKTLCKVCLLHFDPRNVSNAHLFSLTSASQRIYVSVEPASYIPCHVFICPHYLRKSTAVLFSMYDNWPVAGLIDRMIFKADCLAPRLRNFRASSFILRPPKDFTRERGDPSKGEGSFRRNGKGKRPRTSSKGLIGRSVLLLFAFHLHFSSFHHIDFYSCFPI